jgi:MFS family permease
LPARKRWTLVATILGSSLTFIDGTVVNVALPALQADLQATITDVQWVIEAYALFLGALILVGGSLGDQFGRKRVFLMGVGFFTIASIACGVATSPSCSSSAALQGSAPPSSSQGASRSSARPTMMPNAAGRSARGRGSARSRPPSAR